MIRLNYLDPYVVYRTKPPVLMPETQAKVRKGQAYIVLAPSIKAEMEHLASDHTTTYRYLENYFLEKRWDVTLYGQGHKILKPNEDGDITEMLNNHRYGALAKAKMQQFLPTVKTSPLRGFNTLIEVNHVTETILNNPKDRRMLGIKVNALVPELIRAINAPYIGTFEKTLVIPMDLWVSSAEHKTPETLFKPRQSNPIGMILNRLTGQAFRASLGVDRIVLQSGFYLLILNSDNPEKSHNPDGDVKQLIIRFLKRSASQAKDHSIADEIWDPDEVDAEDDKAASSMAAAEKKTLADIRAEKVMTSMNIDPENVSSETKEQLKDKISMAIESDAERTASKPAKKSSALDSDPMPAAEQPVTVTKKTASGTEVKTELRNADEPATEPTDRILTAEEKVLDTNIGAVQNDIILRAQMEGRSVAQEKRNELLRERYNTLNFGSRPLKDLVAEESAIEIPTTKVAANTINDNFKEIRSPKFEKVYDESMAQHDLVMILSHFATANPAMYLNKNIEIEDVSTRTDRVIRYGVEFEDSNRKRHRFHFKLPKMYKNKYLFLNGQELTITHQKLPFPITKVQPDRCQLVTNYNKIFIYRYGTALSPRMTKLKKILSADNINGIKARRGNCLKLHNGDLTTIEYDELSGNFVRIDIGRGNEGFSFMFDPDIYLANGFNGKNPPSKVKNPDPSGTTMIEDSTLLPLGVNRNGNVKSFFWTSGTSNLVYDESGESYGNLSDFLIEKMVHYVPKLDEELSATSSGTKFMYSRARIMAQDIPLILVMGAADPNGLIGALEKGKIKWTFTEKRPTIDKDLQGVIPFKDGYMVYDRYPFENSLILNGLQAIPTKEYDFYDMNTRDTYVDIFDLMCGQRSLADNINSFYYMMIDPITREVLERLNMPTDFVTLLFWCNGTLADNQFQIDSNYENSRIRSNEIIMAYLYRHLAVAWSQYKSGRTDDFSIFEDAIIKECLTSKIIDPKSKLNITLELENDRNVKLKGPSGMNEDHSFTIEKRAYHPSMRGIVGTNSVPSGEVGINRHMVVNANIEDARGFIKVNGKKAGDYDASELMTPGEFLQPFATESADMERVCMSISQSKHLVPVAKQCSTPVSFDFERVAPYLSNDFTFVAKKNGRVVEIAEDLMILQYEDGSFDDVDLSEHPQKNTDGGFFMMNQMQTKLKAGAKFKEGEILAYDPKVVNDLDFFGDPCVNIGTLARVAFESNGCVYEDSGYITDKFAHDFATSITKQKRVILSKFANIKKIVKIGDNVQANDVLLAFDDTEDEFSSQLLASFTEQMADMDEVIATSAPIISKYTGRVKDIQITYTVPTDEMNPSLRKVVEEYAASANKREKELAKFIPVTDANTIVKSSEMTVPDSRGKVAGTKIDEGVIIDFFIEYDDVAGNGDKGSIGALKFTTCYVIPQNLAGYTESNPDHKIDVCVASFGAFKRMVADVEKVGVLTKVLVETKRQMKDKYGDRIKAELKKK